jgi:hypothetical protein
MAPETGPPARLDGLASCRRCRRLVLALPEPYAPRLAVRWNPDFLERAAIADLVGAETFHAQGVGGPPCSLHRHAAEEDS